MTKVMSNSFIASSIAVYKNSRHYQTWENSKNPGSVYRDLTFPEKKEPKPQHDEILPDDAFSKIKTELKQDSKLPKYVINGLKGDKNANFFDFLKLGDIPYWIGGPILIGVFKAGGKDALKITKQKAAGVMLYYVAAIAAKALIDIPVKIFKGINLNRKYKDVVPLKIEKNNKGPTDKIEYHGVYESIDFTRWDLLENHSSGVAANPMLINENYDKLAQKLGIDKKLNDSDSVVKPYIKKIIAASNAWKSVLIVPLAGLAIGLSDYSGWETWGRGFKKDLKINVFKPKSLFKKAKGLVDIVNDHLFTHVKNSFAYLRESRIGKAFIIGSLALVALANYNILKISKVKEDETPVIPFFNSFKNGVAAANKLKNNFGDFAKKLVNPRSYNSKNNEYIF